jgi:ligand-binding SRPBCC domain-containing protein
MPAREHLLVREITIPRPLTEVFDFFSDASNLGRITPSELHFEIVDQSPGGMSKGTLLDYRLKLFGLPFRWRTLISAWDPPNGFTDVQLKGPYRRWEHTHTFAAVGGGTRVQDRVVYALPLYPLDQFALPLVRWQLGRIFDYRERRLRELLG